MNEAHHLSVQDAKTRDLVFSPLSIRSIHHREHYFQCQSGDAGANPYGCPGNDHA